MRTSEGLKTSEVRFAIYLRWYNPNMCGGYGFTTLEDWRDRYSVSNQIVIDKIYNIRPSMRALVVTRNSPNKGELLTFGIKAPWNEKQLIINAKSETAPVLRTFKHMFAETRCLIPASFFFEWQKTEKGKIPYCIKVHHEKSFALAGIYNNDGFVILTTEPNSLMKPIHNRMPCILEKENEDDWLNPDTEQERLIAMLNPFPAKDMEAFTISSLVNSPKNQGEDILKPKKYD